MSDDDRPLLLVIHGPNLNLLGEREPEVYGVTTIDDVNRLIEEWGDFHGFRVRCEQTNHEGEIIDLLHRLGRPEKEYSKGARGVVLNPGGFTHTSVAIRDAISAVSAPVVEVHISNIHAREEFRSRSLTAPACLGVVGGFGPQSYLVGLDALKRHLETASGE